MNVFVLSELHPNNTHIGWSVSHSLEDTLARTCGATFMYPSCNDSEAFLKRYSQASDRIDFLQKYRHRLFKSWYELDELPTLGEGPNILLIVGIEPRFLLSMFALGPLLDQFDLRVGYLLDGFDPYQFNKPPIAKLDHLFVLSSELADEMRSLYPLNVSFLPLGTNTLALGEYQDQRHIDIIGYGRIHADVHAHLQRHYNQQTGDRIYFHSTFTQPEVKNPKEHITLLNKLLNRSKISLCFEVSNLKRFRGQSPLAYRWFEGWAAGCAVVGKKPFGNEVSELMNWQDSTIDLPEAKNEWLPFFEALLDDEARLAEISRRNYRECRLRHDWCYRLRHMFNILNVPVPSTLTEEIARLRLSVEMPTPILEGARAIAGERDILTARPETLTDVTQASTSESLRRISR